MKLSIQNLNCYTSSNIIINNLSVEIDLDKNRGLAIMGSSGSGKSTFVSSIVDLNMDVKQEGTILLDNKPIQSGEVIICTQDYLLFPHLTVLENIQIASKNPIFEKELIKLFQMTKLLQKYPQQLSGGEQQRVSLLRAICSLPKILILDEPFSNIDDNIKYRILDFLKNKLEKFNVSIILVTHNVKEVYALTKDVLILSEGELLYYGTVKNCYYSQNPNIAKIFGEYNELFVKKTMKIVRPENFQVLLLNSQFADYTDDTIFVGKVEESIFYGNYFRNIVNIGDNIEIIIYTDHILNINEKYKLFIKQA